MVELCGRRHLVRSRSVFLEYRTAKSGKSGKKLKSLSMCLEHRMAKSGKSGKKKKRGCCLCWEESRETVSGSCMPVLVKPVWFFALLLLSRFSSDASLILYSAVIITFFEWCQSDSLLCCYYHVFRVMPVWFFALLLLSRFSSDASLILCSAVVITFFEWCQSDSLLCFYYHVYCPPGVWIVLEFALSWSELWC